jgi:hypothetical protein
MKVLTVYQPWAWLIATLQKWVENRKYHTPYRGWLAIHAGKSRDSLDDWPCNEDDLAFGAIVAVARLSRCLHFDDTGEADCRLPDGTHMRDHEHTHGPYCWLFDAILPLAKPFPIRGQQGIWTAPVKVLRFSRSGHNVTKRKPDWSANDSFRMVAKDGCTV